MGSVSFWQDKNVLETGCTTICIYLTPPTVHLKMAKMVNFVLCVFYHN